MIHINLMRNRGILPLIWEVFVRDLIQKWIKAWLDTKTEMGELNGRNKPQRP